MEDSKIKKIYSLIDKALSQEQKSILLKLKGVEKKEKIQLIIDKLYEKKADYVYDIDKKITKIQIFDYVYKQFTRGGRPKIGAGLSKEDSIQMVYKTKQDKYIKVRMSAMEKDKFEIIYTNFLKVNLLKKAECSISTFVKDIIFNKDFSTLYQKKNYSNLVYELNKIGININQITKKINSIQTNDDSIYKNDLNTISTQLNKLFHLIEKIQ